jgi:molecular chaperone DnaJ
MPKDYYDILGISRDASDDEVKRSYRKLAKKYHPDVCPEPDAATKFKEISEAYQVLGDSRRRRDYDMFGEADVGPGFGAFDDLFGMFFNDFGSSTGRRSAAERGADVAYEMRIDFREAVFGVEKTIDLEEMSRCSECQGTGAAAGTSPSICPNCAGSGQIRTSQRTLLGNFVRSYTCDRCQGAGEIISTPCSRCGGQGRKLEKVQISIEIPAGIVDGMRLKMNGRGHAGVRGGHPGDLYILIHVNPHELFRRDGDDIVCRIPLTFSQAALGAEIEVPTLNGNHLIEIPAGTQSGKSFRLKGKGVPRLGRRGQGDQIIEVAVEVPTKLNKEQQDLLKKFAEVSGEDLNSLSPGFLRKLKQIL